MNAKIREQVEEYVATNKTEEALRILSDFFKDGESHDEVILIRSRLDRNIKNKDQGRITQEEYAKELVAVNTSILNLVGDKGKAFVSIVGGRQKKETQFQLSILPILVGLFALLLVLFVQQIRGVEESVNKLQYKILDAENLVPAEGQTYSEAFYEILDGYSCTELNIAIGIINHESYKKKCLNSQVND